MKIGEQSVFQKVENLAFLGRKTAKDLDREELGEITSSLIKSEKKCDLYNCIVVDDEMPLLLAEYVGENNRALKDVIGKKLLERLEENAICVYLDEIDALIRSANEAYNSEQNRRNKAAEDAIDLYDGLYDEPAKRAANSKD
jgi:hypothetical protein